MTNKLEIGRDLLQKVDDLLYIMTGHDSYPRLVHKYGKDWWNPINYMRGEICTLLDAPVVERQPVAVPDGWKIVPIEPTEYMMKVARGLTLQQEQTPSAEYRAMVKAAPACLDKVKELNP